MNSLLQRLPSEIIYEFILPWIPCYGLTKEIIRVQKKRILVYDIIQKIFGITKENCVKKFVFHNYYSEDIFIFQNKHIYIYIQFQDDIMKDYLCKYFLMKK